MDILPCCHDERITKQVAPTVALLSNLDHLHPDVLLEHGIEPGDYREGLVFRSAVESIRGTFIASSTTDREGLVRKVLDSMRASSRIADYRQSSSNRRYDFVIGIQQDPDYYAAIEVKGGEGNSINISERPLWAREFGVWCHLDGAIVNQPAHGAHSIINRISNELVRRGKVVDAVFFRDALCGTKTRPCPKYKRRSARICSAVVPDIFLFPNEVPSRTNPKPPVNSLDTLRLPKLILDQFGVTERDIQTHVWHVHVSLEFASEGRVRRLVRVIHQGEVVDESLSKSWEE